MIYAVIKIASILFKYLYFTRLDVMFWKSDQYPTLRLKRNKTNTNYVAVLIMQAVIQSFTYPVITLSFFFIYDPQTPYTPLFSFNNTLFSLWYIIDKL